MNCLARFCRVFVYVWLIDLGVFVYVWNQSVVSRATLIWRGQRLSLCCVWDKGYVIEL
jgi:hypothetical protein